MSGWVGTHRKTRGVEERAQGSRHAPYAHTVKAHMTCTGEHPPSLHDPEGTEHLEGRRRRCNENGGLIKKAHMRTRAARRVCACAGSGPQRQRQANRAKPTSNRPKPCHAGSPFPSLSFPLLSFPQEQYQCLEWTRMHIHASRAVPSAESAAITGTGAGVGWGGWRRRRRWW